MIRNSHKRFADHLKFPAIVRVDIHTKVIAAHAFKICLYIRDHTLKAGLHLPEGVSQLPELIPGSIRNFLFQISLLNLFRRC